MTLQPFDSNTAKRFKTIFNVDASVEHITSLPEQGDESGKNVLTLDLIFHRRIQVSSHLVGSHVFWNFLSPLLPPAG